MHITVKQSKKVYAFLLALYITFYCMMLILDGFVIGEIVEQYNANQSIDAYSLCVAIIGFVFFSVVFVCSILSTVRTMRAIYGFTGDKIVKTYKQTVKLEIPYSVIETVRISGMNLEIYYKTDTAKGVRLKKVDGWFSKSDIQLVKEKITDYNNENNGNINIQVLTLWG